MIKKQSSGKVEQKIIYPTRPYRVLFSYIEKMSEEDRLQFTNANALKYIRGTNPSIYISEKAGSRICKIIRDETGWRTKPGKKVTKRR